VLERELRAHWWAAVASITRTTGDLAAAEDAVQEACLAALAAWPAAGLPSDPRRWLIGTARHKALDVLRREARRSTKEDMAMRELSLPSTVSASDVPQVSPADQLALIFLCCHPALDPQVRVALTLRAVCGLTTREIAAAFLLPEPTLTKRLVRARRKIRETGIPLTFPGAQALPERLAAVLRVAYLVFTEGHRTSTGPAPLREELCDTAIALTRALSALLPHEPEVTGLLALLLLTDARRAARTDDTGQLVLLAEQDRSRYDPALVAEGEALLERALRTNLPGPYQVQAAIAACHSTAPRARHRLAGNRRTLRRAAALRTDTRARGQPRRRRRDGRRTRRRPGHPRHGRPPPPTRPLASAARRPRRPTPTARAHRRRNRRLPGRAPTRPRTRRAELHPAPTAPAHARLTP